MWCSVIVNTDATSSFNRDFNRKLNKCTKMSQNYDFKYQTWTKKTLCMKYENSINFRISDYNKSTLRHTCRCIASKREYHWMEAMCWYWYVVIAMCISCLYLKYLRNILTTIYCNSLHLTCGLSMDRHGHSHFKQKTVKFEREMLKRQFQKWNSLWFHISCFFYREILFES